MRVIPVNERGDWNDVTSGFRNRDIYHLREYAQSLQLHGDGEPRLIYHEENGNKLMYVMMENDIAGFRPFKSCLEKGKYFDWTTPYGYGGPLAQGNMDDKFLNNFKKELDEYCREHQIVSQFFRFHPLLQNQEIFETVSDVLYLKKTVYIDTADEEVIFRNMTPNNRNMVRKARKNGVEIIYDKGEHLEEFIEIYEKTMHKNKAESYYYFEKEYFEFLIHNLKDHIMFFYALYDGKIISASVFFYNQQYMHYHLSGTLPDYGRLAATNLLISEAADWAAKQGIRMLHLGGGVEAEDSLLTFKKHFNRNGLIDFYIGRNVFIPDIYNELVELRAKVDESFDRNKKFMIKYRG